jgi:3'(2'), 5'-bisphosphate nucleotidase
MYTVYMIDVQKVVDIAKEAGEKIMEVYNSGDFQVEIKDDESPLTKADLASSEIIIAGLKKYFPDIPIMSEETEDAPYEKRKDWSSFWCVDPLDGTKEFIKRNGEFTVNIALIEDRTPVLGVIFAPAKGVLYFSNQDGAWKEEGGVVSEISVSSPEKKLVVVGSRSHHGPRLAKFVEEKKKEFDEIELVSRGSSIKMCLVAEGVAHVYPRLGHTTMEWDTAAGHAIVVAAGGSFEELDGSRFEYNKPKLLNPGFKAKGDY